MHGLQVGVGCDAVEDGTVLEGIVDLMCRDDDGTVVIGDYKTDAVPVAALGARVAFYRPQVLAYRRPIEAATGSATRAVLLFLNPGGSVAISPDQHGWPTTEIG